MPTLGTSVQGIATTWKEILHSMMRMLGFRMGEAYSFTRAILATKTGNYEDTILINTEALDLDKTSWPLHLAGC